jgi:hypothetical protein
MSDDYIYTPTAAGNYSILVTASDAYITVPSTFILEVQNPLNPIGITITVSPNVPQINIDSGKSKLKLVFEIVDIT